MTLFVNDHQLQSFENWLNSQEYQTNTIRNYLLDIKDYLHESNNTLSSEMVSDFITRDAGQNNHARHLASISMFCQFALDQQLTTENILTLAKKHAENPSKTYDLKLLLNQFAQSLAREHKSPITIKNYLGDIRQYIRFCESKTL